MADTKQIEELTTQPVAPALSATGLADDAALDSASVSPSLEDTFVLPASREQTRYWMLAQLDPTSTASNMAISFDIQGDLVEAAVEEAIAALTMRHEALRTLFRLEAGVLSQVILNRPLYSFQCEDLSDLPENQREDAANESVSRHGHTLIDLHAGPALHARLIHLDRKRHILALTMNHIVCDGWSNGILIRDFTLLYEGIVTNKKLSLPDLPFQFADFSLWQQEYLASPEAEAAAAFWRSRVTADLPALDLPTDFPREAGRSFPGHIESALLPKSVDDKLMEYCRTSGSTKHIVLLAAFEALCARYTGQAEFLLGSTIANRTQPGMENVVGRFANPQIIVAKVNGDPTFAALEQSVRESGTEAYNHQDLPFSRIIEDFQISQEGATSQFLQVWFLYQKAFMQPQAGASILVTPRRSVSGGVDFDLLVSIVERAEGPRIQMEYNTRLFSPERIRGLIKSFIHLLEDALTKPSQRISALARSSFEILPSARLLSEPVPLQPVNEPSGEAAGANRFFDRLRASALNLPDSVAIVGDSDTLSWSQIDSQSSSVATELKRRNITSASTVLVLLTDAVTSVTALIGALKAGSQVLPLPSHATSMEIEALMTKLPGSLLLAPSPFTFGRPHLSFEDIERLPGSDGMDLEEKATLLFLTDAALAESRAVPLSSLIASLATAAGLVGLNLKSADAEESILSFPAAGPVEACMDRLMAVASGSQLTFGSVLASNMSAKAFEQILTTHQVTRILLSPAELRKITKQGWRGDRRVSIVLRGGRLPALADREQDDRLPRYFKSAVYLLSDPGSGGYVAYQKFSQAHLTSGLSAMRGEISVRDHKGQPVPPGALGRLHLDGVPVDIMARSRAGGMIEAMDRADRFVQLRGHRICLGEIEDALRRLDPVEDGFATIAKVQGEDLLVAYLVPVASQGSTASSFTPGEHLSALLPGHMVPAEYVWLEKLPLTTDGRIDNKRLPEALTARRVPPETSSEVMTGVEEKLAGIWKDVLGLRHVDIHTPFFEMGGSSLLLVRLFARINKAFDAALPITAIFDAKTVAALARTLGGDAQISPLVKVQTEGSKPALFMIHSYLLYKGLSTSLGAEQPFYGLRELDQDGHLTIEERVSRYVTEIRKVQAHGPYHLAGWCAAGPLTVEVARQLMLAGEAVNYIALLDSWLPGYLESIESEKPHQARRPFQRVSNKLSYHRRKMIGLKAGKKIRYVWMASTRILREVRYHLYLKNWERLRRLSERYQFALPQFMHNTSLDTFSALKHYRENRLPIRLTLIRASDAREIPGAAASCGWERVAEHGVDVLWASGDHESMFVGENLQATASILARGLEAANSRPLDGGCLVTDGGDLKSVPLRGATLHVDCPIP